MGNERETASRQVGRDFERPARAAEITATEVVPERPAPVVGQRALLQQLGNQTMLLVSQTLGERSRAPRNVGTSVPADPAPASNAPPRGAAPAPARAVDGDSVMQEFLQDPKRENERKLASDPEVAQLLFTSRSPEFPIAGPDAARNAVAVLRKLPREQLRPVLAGLSRTTQLSAILGALPELHGVALQPLFDAAPDFTTKLALWRALHIGRAFEAERQASPLVSSADLIRQTEVAETNFESQRLVGRYERAVTRARRDPRRLAEIEQTFQGELTALDERKRAALALELKYNVTLISRAHDRSWSADDLRCIDDLLSKLPESVVRDNKGLQYIIRDTLHSKDAGVGGETGTTVTIFDPGLTGRYRMTGSSSPLAHVTNLQPFEEALTHEIGHSVHEGRPELLARFQRAAGEEIIGGRAALRARLLEAGAPAKTIEAKIEALAERAKKREHEPIVVGHVSFQADIYAPDKVERFVVRRLGSLAGEVQLAGQPDKDYDSERALYQYAAYHPMERYAELFTQMTQHPEVAYEHLVAKPQAYLSQQSEGLRKELAAAEEAVEAADAARARSESDRDRRAHGAAHAAYLAALERRNSAREQLGTLEFAAESRRAQWTQLRETLGIDALALRRASFEVDRHLDERFGNDSAQRARAASIVDEFHKQLEVVATPWQLRSLVAATKERLDRP